MYVKIIDGKQVFSSCDVIKTEMGVYISNPTPEQIAAEGWQEYIPDTPTPNPIKERMDAIKSELKSLDYLTSKYVDGEDMSEYGDWQQYRRNLREEYRSLEREINI